MEITSEQAYEWADNHRKHMVLEIEYLIEELEASKRWLENESGYGLLDSPETRVRQIRKEQYHAETFSRLAEHIEYQDKKEA
jgi:hypothetical protein